MVSSNQNYGKVRFPTCYDTGTTPLTQGVFYCYTIFIQNKHIMNIYLIGQKNNARWFGVGETRGQLMISTHGIPRAGSDYNKARDAQVIYTEVGFWVGVDIRDKAIHKWLVKQPGIKKVGHPQILLWLSFINAMYMQLNVLMLE